MKLKDIEWRKNVKLKDIDLAKLNSATAYPSIPTYHVMDKGTLTEATIPDFPVDDPICATEKIDGTNSRIIFIDDTYIIGSRNNLLTAQNDLIFNPAEFIVETVRPIADLIGTFKNHDGFCTVVYGESYGGKIQTGSNYSSRKETAFRCFDIAEIPLDILDKTPDEISKWRESGGQQFANTFQLNRICDCLQIPMVVYCKGEESLELPKTLEEGLEFLKKVTPTSKCLIDEDGLGKSEGVVVRTIDRKWIAKLRYEDYLKALRRK